MFIIVIKEQLILKIKFGATESEKSLHCNYTHTHIRNKSEKSEKKKSKKMRLEMDEGILLAKRILSS